MPSARTPSLARRVARTPGTSLAVSRVGRHCRPATHARSLVAIAFGSIPRHDGRPRGKLPAVRPDRPCRDRPWGRRPPPRCNARIGVVHLAAATGRRDDDPIRCRKSVEERSARRRAIDHSDRSFDGFEPPGQLQVGHVRAAKVEFGLAAIEGAVADQDEPERLVRGRRSLGQDSAEAFAIGRARGLGQSDLDRFRAPPWSPRPSRNPPNRGTRRRTPACPTPRRRSRCKGDRPPEARQGPATLI